MPTKLLNTPHNPLPEHASLGLEEAFVLGYNVERLRKLAHMDIATFAQVAGITRPTVYKVERGESNLKLSYLRKIADALDVSVIELLTPPHSSIDSSYYQRRCFDRASERKEKANRSAQR
ncbi:MULTISPECIES: helix-turn-helix domain-containing protein [unclassified Adlercreutzia]|uniref:helix-turn-helix domain-containing protein n=1 Tax=unclassified Adlercreutzia TaxID=2636013 RepID=UPI0013ECA2BC|nr:MULTISPECIES: helix-turn-helix transcriptional regulator [unclassified Adlercreutzia]